MNSEMKGILNRVMSEAWIKWHIGLEDDEVPRINPSFEKGFWAAVKYYEKEVDDLK